jgi:hypothetical protein
MSLTLKDDLNFTQDGKHISALRIPHSTNSSGWGSLLLPVIVVRNGTGQLCCLPEEIMVMNMKVQLR